MGREVGRIVTLILNTHSEHEMGSTARSLCGQSSAYCEDLKNRTEGLSSIRTYWQMALLSLPSNLKASTPPPVS
jgi:hypothetical protein